MAASDLADVKDRLKAYATQQAALARLSIHAFESEDFPALAMNAADLVQEVLGVDHGIIVEVNPFHDSLRHHGWTKTTPTSVLGAQRFSELAEDAAARVLVKTGATMMFSDISHETRFRLRAFDSLGTKAGICAIIKGEDGDVIVYALSKTVRVFTDDEIAFAESLAYIVGILLNRDKMLRELHLRDRAITSISQGITITDYKAPGRPIVYTNQAFANLTGYSIAEIIGRKPSSFFASDKFPEFETRVRAAAQQKQAARSEYTLRCKNGTTILDSMLSSLMLDANGDVSHIVTVHEDVTALRRREHMMAETQKMESVGYLTGGIAHDFNNLLTAIKSNAEDLYAELKDNRILQTQANIVLRAADRGAGLVSQLTAFARKQELKPRAFDPNALVDSAVKLLRGTLPPSIVIETRAGEALPEIFADPARLESALVNLALNARDAMPAGGTMTIKTAQASADGVDDLKTGAYVVITVSDTGLGMTPDVLDQAFVPFFTTKEVGKGTGLGLSMVHGFMKQSGGQATIASEPGHGTAVMLYLPVVGAEAQARDTIGACPAAPHVHT